MSGGKPVVGYNRNYAHHNNNNQDVYIMDNRAILEITMKSSILFHIGIA